MSGGTGPSAQAASVDLSTGITANCHFSDKKYSLLTNALFHQHLPMYTFLVYFYDTQNLCFDLSCTHASKFEQVFHASFFMMRRTLLLVPHTVVKFNEIPSRRCFSSVNVAYTYRLCFYPQATLLALYYRRKEKSLASSQEGCGSIQSYATRRYGMSAVDANWVIRPSRKQPAQHVDDTLAILLRPLCWFRGHQ